MENVSLENGELNSNNNTAISNLKILIADDDNINRYTIISVIEELGYTVFEARNGLEAVDIYIKEKPDIVIIDIMMPVMDGFEATRLIKSHAKENYVPVIVISAMDSIEAAEKCVQSGADDFINRPYDPEVLKSKIKMMIRISHLHKMQKKHNERLYNEIYQRKIIESKLKVSEELYRSIFEQAGDSIIMIDLKTKKFVKFNDQAFKKLGYTKQEFKELNISQIENSSSPVKLNDRIEIIKKNGLDSFETDHVTKEGNILNFIISAKNIIVDNNNLIQIICHDITKIKEFANNKQKLAITEAKVQAEKKKSIELELAYKKLDNSYNELYIAGEKIEHLNDLLKAIKSINKLIISEKNVDKLIEKACKYLVGERRFSNALIVLFDNEKIISSSNIAFNEEIHKIKDVIEKKNLDCELLLPDSKKTIFIKKEECINCPIFKNHNQNQIICIKIIHEKTIFGLLSLKKYDKSVIEDEELSLIKQLCYDIGFALHSINQENKQKQATEALKINNERFHSLVNNMPILIIAYDENGKIVFWNKECEKVSGYNANEMIDNNDALEILFPDEKYRNYVNNQLNDNKEGIRNQNVKLTAKSGSEKIISLSQLSALYPVHGWKTWTIGVDISLQIMAENRLKNTINYIENIVTSMLDSLIVIDTNAIIKKINQAALDLSGYKEDELLEKNVSILFEDNNQTNEIDILTSIIKKLMNREALRNQNINIQTKNNDFIPVSISGSAMIDNNDNIAGIVLIGKDMREIRETTAQLVQAEKLSALGELTAGVTHELKQPLNVIKIISQSLTMDIKRDRLDIEELNESLDDITNQINRMAEIIDHMRVFTRRSDNMPFENISANTLIDSVFKFFSQQFKVNNIEIIKDLIDDPPLIQGDPIRLEQVLVNLLTNARRAVDQSKKENKIIDIKTYTQSADESPLEKDSVVISVKDNGNGVPEHLTNKIFEQFFTTSVPGEGTGLGLSISKKIVEEQHNGKLVLVNEIDKGANFLIILPTI